jgi:hypothetical protein
MTNLKVHEFLVGDVEDPEVYAALPIMQFMDTEKGIWCKEHSDDQMTYEVHPNIESLGFKVIVCARFSGVNLTMFYLKYMNSL